MDSTTVVREFVAKVDVGDNTANLIEKAGVGVSALLEKLVDKIGIAADAIFPWYVKQQVIAGWCHLVFYAFALIVGFFIMKISYNKNLMDKAGDPTKHGWLWEFGFYSAAIAMILLFIYFSDSVSMIINPEYHAMKSIVSDLAKIRP